MARPERNNVDYFPFMCEDGKKMFYIEETYGNDGFATFVKILRELAKTEYHYLDLSKPTTLMFLSAKCKVSKELLLAIINDLVDLGKFNELLWNENKIIWCQDFIDSIQDAYKKRNNKCISFEGLLTLLTGLGIRKPVKNTPIEPVKPQSKVEYSKVNKSKEDDVVKTPKATFFTLKDFQEQVYISDNEFTLLTIRKTERKIEELATLLPLFIEEQKALTKLAWSSQADARNHFINWVNKQPKAKKSKFVA